MSYVVVNALRIAAGAAAEVERRFARRAGAVEHAPGFEHFELLRPVAGTDSYLVYTRWATRGDFDAWQSSQDFSGAHAQAAADAPAEARPPVVTGNEVWSYEVVQSASGSAGASDTEA